VDAQRRQNSLLHRNLEQLPLTPLCRLCVSLVAVLVQPREEQERAVAQLRVLLANLRQQLSQS
jgi:hypothetical protein